MRCSTYRKDGQHEYWRCGKRDSGHTGETPKLQDMSSPALPANAGVTFADTFVNGLRLASFTDCMLSPTNDLCGAVSDNITDGFAPSALIRIDFAFPTNELSLWLPNDEPAALWCPFAEVGWPQPRTRSAAFSGPC
jgi:hypothetical protein